MDKQEQFEQLKKAQSKLADIANQQTGSGSTQGILGTKPYYEPDAPCRVSLTERVTSQLSRARMERLKFERLYELNSLLEQNPVLARILDLLEDVKG